MWVKIVSRIQKYFKHNIVVNMIQLFKIKKNDFPNYIITIITYLHFFV